MIIRTVLTKRSKEREDEESMIPVCCEGLEIAVAAGILVRAPNVPGIVYVRSNNRHWAIQFCPQCGTKLELPPSTAYLEVTPNTDSIDAIVEEEKRLQKKYHCRVCLKAGHNSRSCPLVAGGGSEE